MANLVKFSEQLQQLSQIFEPEEIRKLSQVPIEVQNVLAQTPVLQPTDDVSYKEAEARRLTIYRKRQEVKKQFKDVESKLKQASQTVKQVGEIVIQPLLEREKQQAELNRAYEQEKDWQKAIRINTKTAYQQYIEKHSKKYGKDLVKPLHYDEAIAKIKEFEAKEQQAINNFNRYWQDFQTRVFKAVKSEDFNQLILDLDQLEKFGLEQFGHLREEALKKISYYRHELEHKLRVAEQRELEERQREALLRQQAEQLYSTLELMVGTLDEVIENAKDMDGLTKVEEKIKQLASQNYHHLQNNANILLERLKEKLSKKREELSAQEQKKQDNEQAVIEAVKKDIAVFKSRIYEADSLEVLGEVLLDIDSYEFPAELSGQKEAIINKLHELYETKKMELVAIKEAEELKKQGKVKIDGHIYDEFTIKELAAFYKMDKARFFQLKAEKINDAIKKMRELKKQGKSTIDDLTDKQRLNQALRKDILKMFEEWFRNVLSIDRIISAMQQGIITEKDFVDVVKKVYNEKAKIHSAQA